MSLGCACADDLRCEVTPSQRREPLAPVRPATNGRRIRLFVVFVLRTFYVLAIRRCKPGPIRWP
jgi:hypothetical protein